MIQQDHTRKLNELHEQNECAKFKRGTGEESTTCFMKPKDANNPTDTFRIMPYGDEAA